MVSHARLDRREFLALSALTSVATLLPESVYATQSSETDRVSLEVTGDAQHGYGVAILYRGRAIARHHQGGEFSAVFQNDERSLEDRVDDWKATSWKGDGRQVHLSGEMQLTNLRTTVFVEVTYEIVSTQVMKKTIQLRQADMFALLYQIKNRLDPETTPAKLWSFDHADCKGGALHEYFPAAGFRTQSGVTVGLLTDSGYRNQWSRIIRRDGTPVKPAPASIPDLNLYCLPKRRRSRSARFIHPADVWRVHRPNVRSGFAHPNRSRRSVTWKRSGKIEVEQQDAVVKLSPVTVKDFVLVPFSATGGEVYSVSLKYRSAVPISIHAWDTDDEFHKLGDLTLFNDTAPASPSAFTEFRHSFVVPALQGTGAAIVLSLPDFLAEAELRSEHGRLPSFEIRDLEVSRIATRSEPYHRLEMDRPQVKTTFIFVSDSGTRYLRRLSPRKSASPRRRHGFQRGRHREGALRGRHDVELDCRSAGPASDVGAQHLVFGCRRDVPAR